MTEEAQPKSPPDPWRERLLLGHETRDVSVRGLIIFAVWFIVSAAVVHLLIWLLLKHLSSETRPVDLPLSAVARVSDLPPNAPPLQPRPEHDVVPRTDLMEMHKREDAVFTQLGWTMDAKTHQWTASPTLLKAVMDRPKPATAPTAAPATNPTVTPIPGVDQGARSAGVLPMPFSLGSTATGDTPALRGREAGDAH